MSSSRTPSPDNPGGRREALRRQQQASQQAARRTGLAIRVAWITGLAVIAVMVTVIVWSVVRPGSAGVAAGALVAPAGATESGAVVIGTPDAPVAVAVYADFLCPFCGEFERANGPDLAAAVNAGTARLEVHPMSFLDPQSAGTRYSTRAANAFVTIANVDPARAWAFYRVLFEQQPAEGSAGLSDAQLVDVARQVGVPDEVTATFAAGTFVPWVQRITDQAWDSGVGGTPTVRIDGQVFTGDVYTAGPLAAAIEAAARG